ncbi:MAG TPA: hypothetical protein VNT32_00310 [Thermoleophilaceae bacterium]|nr:hypothetical protein [Thermoleophilaceae bacterium]
MILFCAGIGRGASAGAAAAAVESVATSLPFFPGCPVERWEADGVAAAWVAHDPGRIGGIRYVSAAPGGLSLFAGRPFRWTAEAATDGDGPLAPAFYAAPAEAWASDMDGRFAALRASPGEAPLLEVVTDPVGAYPVFSAEADGARWVSNVPEVLALLAGPAAPRPAVLASLLGGGWSLSGDPLHGRVSRVPPGITRYPSGEHTDLLPAATIAAMPGAGFDPDAAAAVLVAALGGLAGWPGRPDVVPVTGGRDSRVVLGAALAAGIGFEATTGGPPDAPDVVVGRALCERAGIPHVPLAGDPSGDMWGDPRGMARVVSLLAGGTACVADAAGFPLGPRDGPLVLWHSGQGGETGRRYYGAAAGADASAVTDGLVRAFTGRRPGRQGLLSAAGEALVRAEIGGFVEERIGAGADPRDVPDLFYLERRMRTWAAPSHACVEPVKDTTSPLWSARLVPHLLGPPRAERALERFHLRVLERLAPDLVDLPFEGGGTWAEQRPAALHRLARARDLARKAAAEARRRLARPGPAPAPAADAPSPDPFAAVHRDVAGAVAGDPGNPAWEVLDHQRVERLLARDPGSLDVMSRYYVWRLGQVFWEGGAESAGNRAL